MSSNGHTGRRRDVAHERALTASAASVVGVPSAGVQSMAEARALAGPLRGFPLRDFALDGLEEGADWRNYLCWQVLVIDASGIHTDDVRRARGELATALALVIAAWERTQAARAMLQSAGMIVGMIKESA